MSGLEFGNVMLENQKCGISGRERYLFGWRFAFRNSVSAVGKEYLRVEK